MQPKTHVTRVVLVILEARNITMGESYLERSESSCRAD